MKLRTRRDSRLRKRFRDAKKLEGIFLGRQIRDERRMWKKTMSKHSRRLDQDAIEESMDLFIEDDDNRDGE